MPVVDANGRVFGRWNLIDAFVVLLLLGLVPLAYGAYVLFQTPPPRLLAIEPATLVNAPGLRVSIKGENLRPYMRVSFNDVQGNSFIFRSTSEALIDLNPMPPGVYDVVLYDNAQERSRLVKAFTLAPTPLPDSQVFVVGTIGNLTLQRAQQITAGMTIAGIGEITEVSSPLPEATRVHAGPVIEIPVAHAVRVPVTIRAACRVRAPQGVPQCAVGDAAIQVTSILMLNTAIGTLPFQVDQIRGLQPLEPVDIRLQVTARSEIVAQLRTGDIDSGQYANPLAAGAVLTAVERPVSLGSDTDRVDVTLRAQAQRGSSGWIYASVPVRAGAALPIRTSKYELQGLVLSVTPPWTAAQ